MRDARGALVGGDSSAACAREAATVCAGAADAAADQRSTARACKRERWPRPSPSTALLLRLRLRRRRAGRRRPARRAARAVGRRDGHLRRREPAARAARRRRGARDFVPRYSYDDIVGQLALDAGALSPARQGHRVATSTVLINGENGTGKELIARAIHYNSRARRASASSCRTARVQRQPPRLRAVRPQEGRVHRRHRRQAGPLRGRRQRHLLPRRDRRHVAGAAGQAAARAAGGDLHARRRHDAAHRRRAHHRRDQPRPEEDGRARRVPRGPLLPHQRHSARRCRRCASGARTSRRSSTTSCEAQRQGAAAQGEAAHQGVHRRACSSTRGRATSASSRTRSSGWWCSAGDDKLIGEELLVAAHPPARRARTGGAAAQPAGGRRRARAQPHLRGAETYALEQDESRGRAADFSGET